MSKISETKRRNIYIISLVVMSVIWGLGFPFTDLAFKNGFDPSHVIAGRFIVASLFLSAVFWKRFKNINRQYIIFGTINALVLFLMYVTQVVGQKYTTSAKTAFITQIAVILVPFINVLVNKEKITKKAFLTAGISLAGIYFLSVFNVGFENIAKGDYIVFLCAIFGALNAVIASNSVGKKQFDPILFSTILFIGSAVFSIIYAVSVNKPLPPVSVNNYWPIIFMGLMNTAVGFLVHTIALTKISANVTTVIVSAESLWAAIVGVAIGIDDLTSGLIIGGILILLSTVWASIEPHKKEHL